MEEEEDDDDEISPQDENDLEPRSPETFTDALDNSNDFDTKTRKSKIEDSSELVTRTKRRKI